MGQGRKRNSLSNPGKGTENRNDDHHVGNDASGDDCLVLDCAVTNDIDNLVDEPTGKGVSALEGS